jgi:large subunit ribosomal protein L22
MNLIRGNDVNKALATLQFTRKGISHDVAKVLRSAIANAQQKEGFGGDIDRLYVSACYADQGPSMKRIRPAPMGRAFRVLKRTAHLTVRVAERPLEIAAVPAAPASRASRAKEKTETAEVAKAPAHKRSAAPKKAAPKSKKSKKSRKK